MRKLTLEEKLKLNLELKQWKVQAGGSSFWKLQQDNLGAAFGHCPICDKRQKDVSLRESWSSINQEIKHSPLLWSPL